MSHWIAFFRGVNVGGAHALPMKQLVVELEALGLTNVRTYIQSGNAVFETSRATAAKLAQRIAECVREKFGFEPRVLVLSAAELAAAVKENPFPQADENPKSLHLFFLAETPRSPDVAALAALRARGEEFVLAKKVFYLYTPNGFGVSKLAERAERLLGVTVTARNWRTVTTVLAMAS